MLFREAAQQDFSSFPAASFDESQNAEDFLTRQHLEKGFKSAAEDAEKEHSDIRHLLPPLNKQQSRLIVREQGEKRLQQQEMFAVQENENTPGTLCPPKSLTFLHSLPSDIAVDGCCEE